MNKHTQLPWSLASKIEDDEYSLNIVPSNGSNYNAALIAQSCQNVYFDGDEARANAEFIVTACNNHYQLVEALANIIDHCEKYFANFGTIGGKETELVERAKSIINNIKN